MSQDLQATGTLRLMQYLITGKAPEGVTHKLRRPGACRGMIWRNVLED